MTTLLLVRHGETVSHADNRYAGSSDVALTDAGLAQAARLAEWAGRQTISAVYASDLSRAVITATPSARTLGLSVRIDARLREVDFGRGENLTTAEMRAAFPDALDDFHERPGHSPLPGGESGVVALDRVWPALQEMCATWPDDSVLVVMHSTLLRLILCRALGIAIDRYRATFPAVVNGAITSLLLGPDGASLLGYNVPTAGAFDDRRPRRIVLNRGANEV